MMVPLRWGIYKTYNLTKSSEQRPMNEKIVTC